MSSNAVKIFLQLVRLYSPTYHEEQVREYIVRYLEHLAIKYKIDNFGNVIARVEGNGSPLILSAHMDTVEPCKGVTPIIKKGIIYPKNKTILGADDKAGIASILSLVTSAKKRKKVHRSLELIFTVQEEVHCQGARNLNYHLVKGKEAIVLDRSAPTHAITISTPHIEKINIVFQGRAAHSRSPEDGINAISMFSDFISKIKSGRHSINLVSNVGIVNGGKACNVIPDYVKAEGEIRSLNKVHLAHEIERWKKVSSLISMKYGGEISIENTTTLVGFSLKKRDTWVKKVGDSIRTAGFTPTYVSALGGSDANVFFEQGIKAIPLGQGRSGAHGLEEQMPIQAFVETEKILLSLIF